MEEEIENISENADFNETDQEDNRMLDVLMYQLEGVNADVGETKKAVEVVMKRLDLVDKIAQTQVHVTRQISRSVNGPPKNNENRIEDLERKIKKLSSDLEHSNSKVTQL